MIRVFLTGATGFIGGRLLERLQSNPDVTEIRCLVRNPQNIPVDSLSPKVTLFKGDITDISSIHTAMNGADIVFHLAAYYELGIAKAEIKKMEQINVVGTENVLRASKTLNIPKIIYISTVYALGDSADKTVDETHQHCKKFTCEYRRTKYEAHMISEE